MDQTEFLLELNTAIREDIKRNGGFKEIGHELRPKKTPDDAATWLRNATNENQDDGIDQYELLNILDRAAVKQRSAIIEYLGQRLGFKVQWIEPESELIKTHREIGDDLKSIHRKFSHLEAVIARIETTRGNGK